MDADGFAIYPSLKSWSDINSISFSSTDKVVYCDEGESNTVLVNCSVYSETRQLRIVTIPKTAVKCENSKEVNTKQRNWFGAGSPSYSLADSERRPRQSHEDRDGARELRLVCHELRDSD